MVDKRLVEVAQEVASTVPKDTVSALEKTVRHIPEPAESAVSENEVLGAVPSSAVRAVPEAIPELPAPL